MKKFILGLGAVAAVAAPIAAVVSCGHKDEAKATITYPNAATGNAVVEIKGSLNLEKFTAFVEELETNAAKFANIEFKDSKLAPIAKPTATPVDAQAIANAIITTLKAAASSTATTSEAKTAKDYVANHFEKDLLKINFQA